MTVTSQIKALSAPAIDEEIAETRLLDIVKTANSNYELCFNTSAPSAGGQTYTGHDHTPSGGGAPIFRGGQWSASGRRNTPDLPLSDVIWSNVQNEHILGEYGNQNLYSYFYPSPGLEFLSLYQAWILVSAYHDYTYEIKDNQTILATVTGGGSSPDPIWIQISIPTYTPFLELRLETLALLARPSSYKEDTPPRMMLYAISISETPSQIPYSGNLLNPPINSPNSGGVGVAQFPPLAEELFEGDQWLDSLTVGWVSDFSNELFSGTYDSTPPSGKTQVCKGHDHSTNGGRAVARGRVSTMRSGGYLYAVGAVDSSYIRIDRDESNMRYDDGFGVVRGWVSDGITSTGDEPTSLCLTMVMEFYAYGAEDTLTFQVTNINSGFQSVEYTYGISVSDFLYTLTMEGIPCEAGWNEWDIFVKSGTGEPSLQIVSVSLCEVPSGGAFSPPPGSSNPR